MNRRELLQGGSALALLSLAGRANAQPRQHVITMANMSYGRIPSGIKVGDTIVWVNRDNVPHTATARNRSFNVNIPQGRRASMTVRQPGNIAFYCIYHPQMRGQLTVSR